MKEVKVRAQKRTYTSLMYLRTKSRLDAGADQTSCRGGWVSGIKVLLLRVCIGGMGCGVVSKCYWSGCVGGLERGCVDAPLMATAACLGVAHYARYTLELALR